MEKRSLAFRLDPGPSGRRPGSKNCDPAGSMMQPLQLRQTVKRARENCSMWVKDSFRRFVIQYHRRLLSDGTLIVQVLLMMGILPYIFPPQWAAGASKNIGGLSPLLDAPVSGTTDPCCHLDRLFPMRILVKLTSIGISLERENFEYLRSSSDFKRYLFMKFWLLYLVIHPSLCPSSSWRLSILAPIPWLS